MLPCPVSWDAGQIGDAVQKRRSAHSVQTELVALDVLHHEAGLVDAIGKQELHPYRATRDQPCALRLEYGQAFVTDESAADPDVEMQPVLDDLSFGDALEEQPRAHA